MSERIDNRDMAWPARPWLMAMLCAVAGLLFDLAAGFSLDAPVSPPRQAAAAFIAMAAISFVMTIEKRRWHWALGFALGWGLVVSLVGWFTARYNQVPQIFEFPFLSGIFAVLLAAPLFQTVRDEGAWRFPYPRLHAHAWTDAVIGAASLAFVGVTFLLATLISGLFGLIGIDVVKQLLRKEWFDWMLAGFAFGSAVGMLRERDQLASTLQRLAMMVLGVLAPVLAAALVMFLFSLPFTGLGKLWESQIPATPLMLVAGAGAILLANAIIGDGSEERSANRVLRLSALVLVLAVLPMAIIAAASLGQRVGQYGWTPERIWGAVAVAVALVYGAMGWWAVGRGRAHFDVALRPLQVRLAIGLCGAAFLLALPILDFGAISANSQVARLASARTAPDKFDWKAMAFDFGPAGRQRLAEIARSGAPDQRRLAAAALTTKDRFKVETEIAARQSEAQLATQMRILPAGAALPPELRLAIAHTLYCRVARCIVVMAGPHRAILAGALMAKEPIETTTLTRDSTGKWSADAAPSPNPAPQPVPNLATAQVEVRTVERRFLVIDGKPVGQPLE